MRDKESGGGGGRGGFRCFSRNMRRHGMDLFDGIFLQKPKMAFRKTPVSKIDAANWTGSDFFCSLADFLGNYSAP